MPKYYRIQDLSKDVSRYIREKGCSVLAGGTFTPQNTLPSP